MIRVLAIGWALGWWSVQPAAAQDCDRPNKAVCEDLKRQQVVSSEDALKGGAGVQGVSAEVEKRASREYGELSAGTREKLHRLVSACFEAARGRNHTEYCAAREAYYGPASPADTQGVVEIGNAGGGENNAGVMGKLPDSDWLPGRYRFTVRSAAAPATNGKAAWDSLGGAAPDPQVRVFADGTMVLETSAKKDTFKPEWGESVEITIEPRTAIKVLMVDDDGPVNDDTMLQWPPQSILTGATYTGSDVLQLFAKVGSALELSDTGGATLILEGQRLP